MTTVFIAGSISISRLHAKVQERIHKIVSSNFNVVVGDADGADSSIQECLRNYQAKNVTVYCTGEIPRNNIAGQHDDVGAEPCPVAYFYRQLPVRRVGTAEVRVAVVVLQGVY